MSSPRESPRAGPPPELLAVRSGSSSGWKTALFPLFQRKTHTELQKKNLGFRWRLYRLLERPNSSFKSLVMATGSKSFARLKKIASDADIAEA